jgi:hypothetical protein
MRISTLDISGITTTVRRYEALLRFARYLLLYNLVILLWVVITKLSQMRSFEGLLESIAGLDWKFAALVLGSVVASYLILAHRLWWAFAVIMVAQLGYFFYSGSAEFAMIRASVLFAIGVITLPPMRPLAPLAIELAIAMIILAYMMTLISLYGTAWVVSARRGPRSAYGRRLAPLEPLRPSRLLDTLLPGHRSQSVTLWEAALFALSQLLFVAVLMIGTFYVSRAVHNSFREFASPQVQQACPTQPPEAVIACWAQYYPWTQTVFDLGAPIVVAAVCLVLANVLRHFGKQHFVNRLAARQISPAGSTLFLRAFRDDQVSIRRASRNLFSSVIDLGRVPTTLDELMLERLDGRGDLIAIGNPQDRKGACTTPVCG